MTIILTASVLSYQFVIGNALFEHNSTYAMAQSYLTECSPLDRPYQDNQHQVILRLDDVQAYGWRDVAIRMMDDTVAAGFPIVAGVIPKDVGTDPILIDFFNEHHCNVEVSLHGYDHSVYSDYDDRGGEFAFLSANEARAKLSAGMAELKDLPHEPVVSFIPPQNQVSTGTEAVLAEFGITHISAEGRGRFDYDAATWHFTSNSFVTADEVMRRCLETFARGDNLCVIMLHPQDFITSDNQLDLTRYHEYEWLLSDLKRRHLNVVRFSDVPL
jgi:hypothetical protein